MTTDKETAARWATRIVSDDADRFDASGFADWLQKDPGNQRLLEEYLALWDDSTTLDAAARILARNAGQGA